jgi:hypothetical protein
MDHNDERAPDLVDLKQRRLVFLTGAAWRDDTLR